MRQTDLMIRQYQPADQPAVWELHVVCMRAIGAYIDDRSLETDLHDIAGVYLHNQGDFLVGEAAGALVAMGALRPLTSTRGEIKRMRVHPTMQGRGYGRAVLLALEARARELGYRELELETSVVQTAALGMYRSHGFVEFKRGKVKHFDCIWFEKALLED
ncbi:MAG: GNAT family N-acetyltransferase [Herpetosiphonaceae bacterium]|nr:GNAT family N-acetyltransferase [Herpetosiphonaceae bacterium]